MNSSRHPLSALLLCGLLLLISNAPAQAGSATWNLNPTSGDWNTATNWTPATVPDGIDQTATFGVSSITNVTASDTIELLDLVFDSGANAYTINNSPHTVLSFNGRGVVNNSGVTQYFNINPESGLMAFVDRTGGGHPPASAGIDTVYTVSPGSTLQFSDDTSADHGTFSGSGSIVFYSESTAADGIFRISGPAGLHLISFTGASSAGNSTLIATSKGIISFESKTLGGTARVKLFDGGTLSIYTHARLGLTIGSLEGDGVVLLGSTIFNHTAGLTIGSNNLNTAFSGLIDDAGLGGFIRKIGTGTLTLSNANTYTGGTTVNRGRLIVDNTNGSGTGSGPVQVLSGTLGGNGIVGGPVAVGTGGSRKATLAPGTHGFGLLTIEGSLTLGSNGIYNWNLETETSQTEVVLAQGITINTAAIFTIYGRGNGVLPSGTIFTAISNTSADPISGTFSNLPEGAIVNVNGNNLEASYHGGDGNDLTLTVVP